MSSDPETLCPVQAGHRGGCAGAGSGQGLHPTHTQVVLHGNSHIHLPNILDPFHLHHFLYISLHHNKIIIPCTSLVEEELRHMVGKEVHRVVVSVDGDLDWLARWVAMGKMMVTMTPGSTPTPPPGTSLC